MHCPTHLFGPQRLDEGSTRQLRQQALSKPRPFESRSSTATVGNPRRHALTCCDIANLVFESAASSDRENRKGSSKWECAKAFRRRLRLSASSHFVCSRFPRPVSHLGHCTTMFVPQ